MSTDPHCRPNNWNPRRFLEISIGHTLYATFNWVFDNILYVWVVHVLGLLNGGLIMTSLSLIQCAITLIIFERMRIDWVGSGVLQNVLSSPNASWWQRLFKRAMHRGKVFVFLVLCIFQDPFITTAYFRHGRFDGLKGRDWTVFLASVVVSNGYWTLRSGVMGKILVGAWSWLRPAS